MIYAVGGGAGGTQNHGTSVDEYFASIRLDGTIMGEFSGPKRHTFIAPRAGLYVIETDHRHLSADGSTGRSVKKFEIFLQGGSQLDLSFNPSGWGLIGGDGINITMHNI